MATNSASTMAAKLAALGPIENGVSYPLPIFERRVGFTKSAMRAARRNGLRVIRIGKRHFVLGADWNSFLNEHGEVLVSSTAR